MIGGELIRLKKILGKMVDEELLVLQNKRYQVKE
jgi:hypothetical protein